MFKAWKKGGDRDLYLVAKRRARREVFMAKQRVQDNLADELNCADARGEIFRIAKQMVGRNRDVDREQCQKWCLRWHMAVKCGNGMGQSSPRSEQLR